MLEGAWREDAAREPGNFGDPMGLNMYSEEMRSKELNNGRMAMLSVLGIFAAEMATGKDAVEQLGLFAVSGRSVQRGSKASFAGQTARGQHGARSRIRAAAAAAEEAPAPFNPAGQVGAMAPLGFFDPLGFAKVGDEAGFRQLRAAELKHGRVAMMASIGALAQHFVRFPFAESARGTFGAVLKEEAQLGIPLLLLVAAMLEGAWREDAAREPGNFGDPMGLNMYSEEMRSKELNNGRMAMLSVLGIFAAEMATGKDAVEQLGLFAVSGRPVQRGGSKASFAGQTASGQNGARSRIRAAAAAVDEAPSAARWQQG